MSQFNSQKQWWIVVVVVVAVALLVLVITDQWLTGYKTAGMFLSLALIGAVFCWVYSINRERLWWAIIPGLGVVTLLVAGIADLLIGTDPSNDWITGLVLGVGALVIAAVLKRPDARQVLIIIAGFAFLVGFAMAPVIIVLKVILILADVLVFGFYLWSKRKTLIRR